MNKILEMLLLYFSAVYFNFVTYEMVWSRDIERKSATREVHRQRLVVDEGLRAGFMNKLEHNVGIGQSERDELGNVAGADEPVY